VNWARILFFLLLFLSARGGEASARTASEEFQRNPKQAYQVVKRVVQSDLEKVLEAHKGRVVQSTLLGGRKELWLSIEVCDSIKGEFKNKQMAEFAELARMTLLLNAELDLIPKPFWQPIITKYEVARLNEIVNKSHSDALGDLVRELKPAIERYIKAHRPSAVESVHYNGCMRLASASDEPVAKISFVILVEPKAKRILYINRQAYKFCQELKLEPHNIELCDQWTDFAGRMPYGRYKILVFWADGTTAVRDLDVDSIALASSNERTFRITK
jgi:hypothetical protein